MKMELVMAKVVAVHWINAMASSHKDSLDGVPFPFLLRKVVVEYRAR